MRLDRREGSAELLQAVSCYREATSIVALTGAGVSVDCGIPDFRSEGGLWTVFPPDEFATIEVFLENPAKAWQLFRALGKKLRGKSAGPAHHGLARLERNADLKVLITQNIDGLHSQAGSRNIFEVHGDHRLLHCLQCGATEPADDRYFECCEVPLCASCSFPLKPNVVLFGESVRFLNEVEAELACCDLLLVLGTSGSVYPVSEFPLQVLRRGGRLLEFNVEDTMLTQNAEVSFRGRVDVTVPIFVEALLGEKRASETCPV